MKFAIISDTHFGDDNCTLVTASGNDIVPGTKYNDFKNAVGQGNDYLILVGDVLDFSIASYDKAYKFGKAFFNAINKDDIAKEMIYIAGNHDADIWHIVQHQRSVINKLLHAKIPEPYEHSVAGIIDDRESSPTKGFTLDKITPQAASNKPKYAGMFLDKITKPDTFFNFAYPNLYIVTDLEAILVTHGQYLEPYWAILGEIAVKVTYDDLKEGAVDVEEVIELNFPLNQLGCTGIGQAGILTKVVRQVEMDVKKGDLTRIKKYLDRLERLIGEIMDFGWFKKLIAGFCMSTLKEKIITSVANIDQTRYSEEFIGKQDVQERFRRFYNESLLEISEINSRTNFRIPPPQKIIFGHTHQPISWDDPNPPKLEAGSAAAPECLTLHNTGGWLSVDNIFCGAEIFKYETGKGFSSVRIS